MKSDSDRQVRSGYNKNKTSHLEFYSITRAVQMAGLAVAQDKKLLGLFNLISP